MLFRNNPKLLDSLLWVSTVGYPSDSLASCCCRQRQENNGQVIWQKVTSHHTAAFLKSSIIFARCQHALLSWFLEVHLGPPFWNKGRLYVEGQQWYYLKEQWWFPIGSPLWPLYYLQPFAIECLRRSNQLGWSLCGEIWGGIGWLM